jgi:hypothetical protein
MSSTLLSSFLSLAWTWIASLDIIDVFHLCLPRPCSYHHIPYVFHVEVQRALCLLVVQLVINPSNITTWHAILLFNSWCLSILPWGGYKGHQDTHTHLCWYIAGD